MLTALQARKSLLFSLFAPFAGLLLTFSFAPFDFAYLAVFSLICLFWMWVDASPWQAAFRGYLFGLGLFGSGISWVYISIHRFGGAPALGAFFLTVFVVAFWALFPALTGYLSARLCVKQPLRIIWCFPLIWILVEYFRGTWFLNGFPWFQVAYTQLLTPLQGFIPVIGSYGTGFLLVFSCILVVACFKRLLSAYVGAFVLLAIWGLGSWLHTISWTIPLEGKLNVALVQGNVAQDKKWQPEYRVKTLLSYRQMTQENWDADIIIWPETAIPAYLSQVKSIYLEPLSAEAKRNDAVVLVSMPSIGQNNEHFNTVLALGKHDGRYDKNHLLPFGEYLPLQPFSGAVLESLGIHLGNFSSGGDQQRLLQVGRFSFSMSICYEDAFAKEFIRDMPEASFLVNVTNDAWFGDSLEPHQHMQIAQMRAIETGRYLLRVTNTGLTAVVEPKGRIISKAPLFKTFVLRDSIIPMQGMTPFSRFGDDFVIVLIVLVSAGLGLFYESKFCFKKR